MQKHILVLVLMFFAMSSAVWAECGKLCDDNWWQTATASNVQAELDAGADVNARDKDGYTPLLLAAGYSTAESIQLLIAAGADVNARTEKGYTPLHSAVGTLHSAVGNSSAEGVQLLIAAGAEVNARDESGYTPLHSAAWKATAETVQLLITAGADVMARDETGYTPLIIAAKYGTAETIEALIAAGADIAAKDEDGDSIWDFAQRNYKLAGTETLWSLAEALGKCSRWCDADWWKQTTAADLQALLDAGVYNKLTEQDRETAWNLAKSSPLKGSAAYWALNDARFK
ncbi:ankyrin repeat domain-containing protein [bacterium]|nr:ankyrin repeat domain-containing protein [bacterium]